MRGRAGKLILLAEGHHLGSSGLTICLRASIVPALSLGPLSRLPVSVSKYTDRASNFTSYDHQH